LATGYTPLPRPLAIAAYYATYITYTPLHCHYAKTLAIGHWPYTLPRHTAAIIAPESPTVLSRQESVIIFSSVPSPNQEISTLSFNVPQVTILSHLGPPSLVQFQ
jgi:hypothetical protein